MGEVALSISVRPVGRSSLITVAGELDVFTAPTLRERIVELVSSGRYGSTFFVTVATPTSRPKRGINALTPARGLAFLLWVAYLQRQVPRRRLLGLALS